jgi:hypothetical protein
VSLRVRPTGLAGARGDDGDDGGGGGDLEKHCGRTLFSIVSMDRLILRLILNVDERLCRAKGRGTWAESARATSRSFGKTLLFLIFDFCFFSSLSLSLSKCTCAFACARAKSEKREKQKAKSAKSRPRFFGALRKGRIQSLSLSLYLNFNRLRKDAKSLSLYFNFNGHILSPFVIT